MRQIPKGIFIILACIARSSGFELETCLSANFDDGSETHHYQIPTYADTILFGCIEQIGVDVETTVFQDNAPKFIVDSNSNREGDETFWLHTPNNGTVHISVHKLASEKLGRYQLHIKYYLEVSFQQLMAVKADLLANTHLTYHFKEELELRLAAGTIGDALRTLGRMVDDYSHRRQYEQGLALLQKYQHLFTREYHPWNHLLRLQMALFQSKLKQWQEAEHTYEQAYDTATEQSPEYAGRIANDLARMLFERGDIYSALIWYERAKNQYRGCFCEDLSAKVSINTAETHSFLGQTGLARAELMHAIDGLKKLPPSPDLALAETELGWVDYLDGDYLRALRHFELAEKLNRKLGHEYQLAGTLDRMGSALRLMGRLDEAMARHSEAMAIFARHKYKQDVAEARANLARDFYEAGDLVQAAALCSEVLPIFRKERPARMSSLLNLAAHIAHDQGHLREADQLYEEALKVVEELYQASKSRALRRSLSDTRYQILADYSLFLWDQGEAEKAFQIVDQTRARILHQRLTTLNQRKQNNEIPSPPEKVTRFLNNHDPGRPLEGSIPPKLDLKRIRDTWLDENTLVLCYAMNQDRSLVFALDKNGMTVHELPSSKKVGDLCRQVYDAANRSHLANGRISWQRYAQQLSDMILKPVVAHLGKRRIVIIPDRGLHLVPFNALPSPTNGEMMIQNHELVELPSLIFGMAIRDQKSLRAAKTLAIFSDPILNPDDPRLQSPKSTHENERNYLPRLYLRSTEQVLKQLGPSQATEFIGTAASRSRFLETDWRTFRYLHLNTHGVLDPQPDLSGVFLCRYSADGLPLEGLVKTVDLMDLNLPLELVTLSACSTAAGEDLSGEGMWGLTAAFMEAGSKRVIASLWDVREKPTSILFQFFYQNLIQKQMAPSAALRAAQLELSRQSQWRAPFYWAGWVIQGEWQQEAVSHE